MANANSYSSKWPRVNRSTYGLSNMLNLPNSHLPQCL
ncbi:hypothetical protein Tco_0340746, partial [Tanacetum coccineum]